MEKLVSLILKAPKTRDYNDDDVVDRLSSRYTVVMLVCFSFLISMHQYVRNPISCWTPAHFSGSHCKYTTSLCWIKNTYYLPWNESVPRFGDKDNRQMIPYYQWVPFILVAQAFFFYMPSLIWHNLNSKAGVDADNILAVAATFSMTDKVETSERTMRMLVQQIHRFLRSHMTKDTGCCGKSNSVAITNFLCCCCNKYGKRFGSYLVTIFLISKVFYIGNVVVQLLLLSKVLSTKYSTFGFDLTMKLINNEDWTEEYYVAFPRVTICDFKVRGQDMVNPHPHTIQCVLPVNMYNEKIYIFLWYWMIIVAIVSIMSFLVWLLRSLLAFDRERFIKNHVLEAFYLQNNTEMPKKKKRFGNPFRRKKGEMVVTVDKPHKQSNFEVNITTNFTKFNAQGIDLGMSNDEFEKNLEKFCRKYLRQDGELILRLIAHNTDHMTTTDVIYELWKNWLDLEKSRMKEKVKRGHAFNV